jgi:hypothetical protein
LTRYFSGNWQTIVQQSASEEVPVLTLTPQGVQIAGGRLPTDEEARLLEALSSASGALEDPQEGPSRGLDQLPGDIEAFRKRLARKGVAPPDWEEKPDGPYFTDKPTFDAYFSLMVWAAYAEHPGMSPPSELDQELWHNDPVFQESALGKSRGGGILDRLTRKPFNTRFPHLLRGSEWWLPILQVGSSPGLQTELAQLNRLTWQADPLALQSWLQCGEEPRGLEGLARFAFAILSHLTD